MVFHVLGIFIVAPLEAVLVLAGAMGVAWLLGGLLSAAASLGKKAGRDEAERTGTPTAEEKLENEQPESKRESDPVDSGKGKDAGPSGDGDRTLLKAFGAEINFKANQKAVLVIVLFVVIVAAWITLRAVRGQ